MYYWLGRKIGTIRLLMMGVYESKASVIRGFVLMVGFFTQLDFWFIIFSELEENYWGYSCIGLINMLLVLTLKAYTLVKINCHHHCQRSAGQFWNHSFVKSAIHLSIEKFYLAMQLIKPWRKYVWRSKSGMMFIFWRLALTEIMFIFEWFEKRGSLQSIFRFLIGICSCLQVYPNQY